MSSSVPDAFALAADRLDAASWPDEVLDAVQVICDEAEHAASCRVCPQLDPLPPEVVAVFTDGGYQPGWLEVADALVELAGELRRADRGACTRIG